MAPDKVVTPPTQEVVCIVRGNTEMRLKIRTVKKIPAATIVAAWVRADMGVGPSMASGNHT